MKKRITTSIALIWAGLALGQGSVRIYPDADTLCLGTTLTAYSPGQSFHPVSYLWSDGSTTPTIQASAPGVYALTVTGTMGQSGQVRTLTTSRSYFVRQRPSVSVLDGPWVCKGDTVRLRGESGYSFYQWRGGSTGLDYSRQMVGSGSGPNLDTLSVWYTAFLGGTCTVNSDTVVIRGIRRPNGVGSFFCGDTDITRDSIPAGLVLTYLYVPQYEMEITQVSDTSNVFTYLTPLGTNRMPSSLLVPGELYSVRTRPVINGVTYCWGEPCLVSLAVPTAGSDVRSGTQVVEFFGECEVYDLQGRSVSRGDLAELLRFLPQGGYLIRSVSSGEVKRYAIVR